MPLDCTVQARSLHAAISGEIDHHGAKGLLRELEEAIDCALPLELCIDWGGVSFMDSSGIALLLRSRQRVENLGGHLRLINVPVQSAKVLRAAGIDRLIPFD